MDRRAHLLESAIAVLARGGARGLTHRAVDNEAGLTPGSTSNVFRTRRDLVTAIVDVLLERSAQRMDAISTGSVSPGTAATDYIECTLSDAADDVRARMALLMDPDAGELGRARHSLLDRDFGDTLYGQTDARRIVVAAIDGILFEAILLDRVPRKGDVRNAIDAVVAAWPVSP